MNRPGSNLGMRHVALYVRDLPACERFYVSLLGMQVEWRPDPANVYLSSGPDNLALHQAAPGERDESQQRLDHIGFFLATKAAVDEWFAFLQAEGVQMRTEPRTHRDGARSFYCYDPDGMVVQIIYHPPVAEWERRR
ncbi:VOC family protein [Candidatus Endoriftia persephonae]|jgi:catechol 2,3-dioxygenase-like lactoylglutathione lyase family enzyme|nr:VOC family protein [Candidatus Endoriftia persephone]KRT54180.1 Glyoxalase-like domain [endosymbiont of Ridgeia piscesae]KRT59792.1 Glyoxalase/Bleomycin resistance protein/Dioxygenase superfamily protein [endosymbiont of Ridgeia piscesae]USF87890.1 VOC family protein [Candidatus Endoriftia persephone]